MYHSVYSASSLSPLNGIQKFSRKGTKSGLSDFLEVLLTTLPISFLTREDWDNSLNYNVEFETIMELALESEPFIWSREEIDSPAETRFQKKEFIKIFENFNKHSAQLICIFMNSNGRILGVESYRCIYNKHVKDCLKSIISSAINLYTSHIFIFRSGKRYSPRSLRLNELILILLNEAGKTIGLTVFGETADSSKETQLRLLEDFISSRT